MKTTLKAILSLSFAAVLVVALMLSVAVPANAAPFCSVHSYGENCWYYSMRSCQQTGNACIINPNEVRFPSGGAPFCVVQSYGTNCWYYDAQSCQQAAYSSGGACVYKGR